MKTLKIFAIAIPLLAFFACEKEGNGQTETKEEVKKYVNELKDNQYEGRDLPAFTDKHIYELLKYRNEKGIITKFPCNPVSSLYQEECELGVYVLWTIESIRIKFANSDLLIIEKFPSLNPILRLRDSEEFVPVFDYDSEAYQILSDAYFTWWTNNQGKTLIEIMKTDPLENTLYKWH
jgi:hypothetical protein